MKHLKLIIAVAAIANLCCTTARAQTADEIVQKHIAAIGGAENWKKLNTVRIKGTMNAGGTELPVTVTYVNMKAVKSEYTMGGMTGYNILTTTKGWNYSPFEGATKPEAMTEAEVKESQDQLDVQGDFIDYKQKGRKVVYLGKDDVEGTECYKLKLTFKNGKEETVFIDAATYYEIRIITKEKANGQEVDGVSNYSNYKKLPEGIVFPMSIDLGGGGPMTVKTVEINKPVDESIFQPKL